MLIVTPTGKIVDKADKVKKVQTLEDMGVSIESPPRILKTPYVPVSKKVSTPRTTPVNKGGRPKQKPKSRLPNIPLTEKLAATQSVTQVAKGHYQNKLKAHFANIILPDAINELRRKADEGDMAAIKLIMAIYEMEPKKGAGVQVNVNQANDNRLATLNQDNRSVSFATPDEMFRLLDADREKRSIGPAPIEFDIVPLESESKSRD